VLYLHKDDAPLLNYIKKRLNLGKVYVYDHFGSFIISKTNELLQLIKIFEGHPLNTTKYFNFLALFKRRSIRTLLSI
jgi:LAGLIDADG endonuclease